MAQAHDFPAKKRGFAAAMGPTGKSRASIAVRSKTPPPACGLSQTRSDRCFGCTEPHRRVTKAIPRSTSGGKVYLPSNTALQWAAGTLAWQLPPKFSSRKQ